MWFFPRDSQRENDIYPCSSAEAVLSQGCFMPCVLGGMDVLLVGLEKKFCSNCTHLR